MIKISKVLRERVYYKSASTAATTSPPAGSPDTENDEWEWRKGRKKSSQKLNN